LTGYSDLWIIDNTGWTFGLVIVGCLITLAIGWGLDKIKKG